MSSLDPCYLCNEFVDDDYERQMFCLEHYLGPVSRRIIREANAPSNWPENVTFLVKGEAVEDVPFNAVGWVLFSDRLKNLVQSAGLAGVSFYPVRLISELSIPVPPYWYVHFAHVPEAIDYDRSMWRQMHIEALPPDRKQPIMMIKYALKREVIDGWDLFRVTEQPSPIFCSERFKKLFDENGCTGLGFDKVPVT